MTRIVTNVKEGYEKHVPPTTSRDNYVIVRIYPTIMRIDDIVSMINSYYLHLFVRAILH